MLSDGRGGFTVTTEASVLSEASAGLSFSSSMEKVGF